MTRSNLSLSAILIVLMAATETTMAGSTNFAQLDKNRDGQLSVGEFAAASFTVTAFKKADLDHNQRISAVEFSTFKKNQSAEQQRPASGPHPPRG